MAAQWIANAGQPACESPEPTMVPTARPLPYGDARALASASLGVYEQALVRHWQRQDELIRRARAWFPPVTHALHAGLAYLRRYVTKAELVWANRATEASDLRGVRNMLDRCAAPVCLAWSLRDAALFLRSQELDAQTKTSDPCRPLD